MKTSSKERSFGSASEAATVRAATEVQLNLKIAGKYEKFIYDTLGICGHDSYENLMELLSDDEVMIEFLAGKILERDDCDGLFQFTRAFVSKAGVKKKNCVTPEESAEFCKLFGPDGIKPGEKAPLLFLLEDDVKIKNYENSQKFRYMDIPAEAYEVLKSDFNIAEHLQPIDEIIENTEDNLKLMIICENEATARLAGRYIAKGIRKDDEYEEDGDSDYWDMLPILTANELIANFGSVPLDVTPFSMTFASMKTLESADPPTPWWEADDFDGMPIIVTANKYSSVNFKMIEALKALEVTHPTIIVIIENNTEGSLGFSEDIMGNSLNQNLELAINDINFKLGYQACFIKEPELESEYNKVIAKASAEKLDSLLDESIDLDSVLKWLYKARKHDWEGNATIMQMVKKAISLKKNEKGVLYTKDFEFLNSNLLHNNSISEKKQLDKDESAEDKMKRCIFGLEKVKQSIMETVCTLKLSAAREKAGLKTAGINKVIAFSGPPGVGKTEMARFFTEIMYENGLLPGKDFISMNAAELKGKYVGHTAPAIADVFKRHQAIFLDEIYSLSATNGGEMDTYSQEALSQLCVELERHGRNKLIIMAGYGGGDVSESNNKMKQFLSSNPGISSRVTFNIDFPAYSYDYEMPEILLKMAENSDYDLEEGWREIAISFFKERSKSENYGNAREARRLLQHVTTVQASRLSDSSPDTKAMRLITCGDLLKAAERILKAERKLEGSKCVKIGF